jgi:hypothetical protein
VEEWRHGLGWRSMFACGAASAAVPAHRDQASGPARVRRPEHSPVGLSIAERGDVPRTCSA